MQWDILRRQFPRSRSKSSSSQSSSLEPSSPLLASVKGQAIDTRQHGTLQPWLHDYLTSVGDRLLLAGPSNQTRPGYQQVPRYVPIKIRPDTTLEFSSFSTRNTGDMMGFQEAETNPYRQHSRPPKYRVSSVKGKQHFRPAQNVSKSLS